MIKQKIVTELFQMEIKTLDEVNMAAKYQANSWTAALINPPVFVTSFQVKMSQMEKIYALLDITV